MPQRFCSPQKTHQKLKETFTISGWQDTTLEIFDSPREYSWDTSVSCDATASEIFGNASVHTISAMFITLYSSLGSHF